MKIQLLLTAAAGLVLIGASPPGSYEGDEAAEGDYPPCSRTVTDRCIQTYERGVKAKPRREEARGGPYEAAPVRAVAVGDYPPCSATVTDRCNQLLRPARSYARAHRVRSAGERG